MSSLSETAVIRPRASGRTAAKIGTEKSRRRGKAMRHGLVTETVLQNFEDSVDYKAFEMAVTADFDAQTAVERELVLRLASVLWRLRRANSIETALMQMQINLDADALGQWGGPPLLQVELDDLKAAPQHPPFKRKHADAIGAQLAMRFLLLAYLDSGAFDRLIRYEMALSREVGDLLERLRRLRRSRNG